MVQVFSEGGHWLASLDLQAARLSSNTGPMAPLFETKADKAHSLAEAAREAHKHQVHANILFQPVKQTISALEVGLIMFLPRYVRA